MLAGYKTGRELVPTVLPNAELLKVLVDVGVVLLNVGSRDCFLEVLLHLVDHLGEDVVDLERLGVEVFGVGIACLLQY